jgi:hypothetical protein
LRVPPSSAIGTAHVQSFSIPKLSKPCILMRKKPASPQCQGLTLVHVRAQLERLQDTFMS